MFRTPVPSCLRSLAVVGLWVMLTLAGCRSAPRTPTQPIGQAPDDFALVVLAPGGIFTETARYVVQPDRWLRVALGEGARTHRFPPRTAQLTPKQMQEIYELAEMARQAAASSASPAGAGMEVTLFGDGQTRRFSIAPGTDAARALADRLRMYRGG